MPTVDMARLLDRSHVTAPDVCSRAGPSRLPHGGSGAVASALLQTRLGDGLALGTLTSPRSGAHTVSVDWLDGRITRRGTRPRSAIGATLSILTRFLSLKPQNLKSKSRFYLPPSCRQHPADRPHDLALGFFDRGIAA